ncbi:ATP-binding cassette domain-containing protein [Mesorhizobium sp. UC22_110]|uniref:ATP-binding cassette domain-containing protein n=1 Tax=Mesorhizobium sp. UC22_110 TaxID=3374552 RepID=UPI0037573FE1
MTELLKVDNLRTYFETERGTVKSVDGISFEVRKGEIFGLVGESGSGKSITGFSLIGLLDANGKVQPGSSVKLEGREIVGLPDAGAAQDTRPRHRDGLPGPDDDAEPGHQDRRPDRHGDPRP